MITCLIDGVRTYPDTSSKIKVTYENPYVKDSGSYTYEISFPLAIMENRTFFNNVGRFEVRKAMPSYSDCKLLAENRLVISGKGTVTSVTSDTLKLQIAGGASRIKYNAKWESDYIDEIDYDAAVVTQGLSTLHASPWQNLVYPDGTAVKSMTVDLSKTNMVGSKGIFALQPVYDETNSIIVNNINLLEMKSPFGEKNDEAIMFNLAPQPYLMYILNKVLAYEGFEVVRNDYDVAPWNRLVIVNTCKSGHIKDALPHWSVYNFIEEFRKLFNASFLFDEMSRTVSVVSQNELMSNETVTYDCEDVFTSEYDEDGLKNLMTSNIEYELADSANRSWREVISQSVRRNFPVLDYPDYGEILNAAGRMSKKERQTCIFHALDDNSYRVWGDLPVSEDKDETSEGVLRVGFFSPIIRNMESDESEKLRMSPVAMYGKSKKYSDGDNDTKWIAHLDKLRDKYLFIPSSANDKEMGLAELTKDDNGDYYVSVVDAMEGADTNMETTNNDTVMQLMFIGENIRDLANGTTYTAGKAPEEHSNYLWPISYTDCDMHSLWTGRNLYATEENGSLALASLPHRAESMPQVIDKNNRLTVKFITDEIPDPSKIYVFRNKRYICEKVEIVISPEGIGKEKTGYFYEINN